MNRLLWLLFIALLTIAGALLLWHMQSVVVLLVAAIALGATLRPAASILSNLGVPRTLSALLMILLVIVLVLGLIAVLGFSLGEELPMMLRDVQVRAVELRASWDQGAGWQRAIAANISAPMSLDEMITSLDSILAQNQAAEGAEAGQALEAVAEASPEQSERERAAAAMLRLMITSAGSVAGLIGQLVILVFVSLYWTLEHEWFERLWISLLPARMRQPARTTWRAVEQNVGMHIRSEVLQSLMVGLILYLGFRLLGVDQALLLATFVALAWLIPLVGGVFALIVLLPIALLSPVWVLIASAVLLVSVLVFMEFVVEPRLDKARDRLEIFGLIMAMVMLQLLGIVGLLLASPLAVAISTAFKTWDGRTEIEDLATIESATAVVRRRLAALRVRVSAEGESLPMRTRSLYERLEEVVEAAQKESVLHLEDYGPIAANSMESDTRPLP
jgi:predicted PurR-regulated permease PerM